MRYGPALVVRRQLHMHGKESAVRLVKLQNNKGKYCRMSLLRMGSQLAKFAKSTCRARLEDS